MSKKEKKSEKDPNIITRPLTPGADRQVHLGSEIPLVPDKEKSTSVPKSSYNPSGDEDVERGYQEHQERIKNERKKEERRKKGEIEDPYTVEKSHNR